MLLQKRIRFVWLICWLEKKNTTIILIRDNCMEKPAALPQALSEGQRFEVNLKFKFELDRGRERERKKNERKDEPCNGKGLSKS